jgi:hypothetical protein
MEKIFQSWLDEKPWLDDQFSIETTEPFRKFFNNFLNRKQTDKELARQQEIDRLAAEEKEKYYRRKAEFYANPLHWDNNKRRRHGLSLLRGNSNKNREKVFPPFHSDVRFFCLMEDMFDEVLSNKIKQGEFFEQIIDMKDIGISDKVTKCKNSNT